MPRRPRGDAALRSAAETIEYEFRMLLAGVIGLQRAPTPEERNLVLEGLLVHARNLRDFFAPTGQPDDILASDFVTTMPRIAMPYLRSDTSRRRFNRLVSHASYSRPRLTRDWKIDVIVREIAEGMLRFLHKLEREAPRRVAWFGDIPGIVGVRPPAAG